MCIRKIQTKIQLSLRVCMSYQNILKFLFPLLLAIVVAILYIKNFTGFVTAVFVFSLVLLFLIPLLLHVHKKTFLSWLKFSAFFLIIATVFIVITPEYGAGGGEWLDLSPWRKDIARWFAALYFLCSMAVIAWKSYRLRRKA